MMGALEFATNHLSVVTSRTKRSSDFIDLLFELDRLCGPQPGTPHTPVVLVLDNGPVHTSKLTQQALADRAHWLAVEWLPKYAPELNDIEPAWKALKQNELAHQTFADADHLDRAIQAAVSNRNKEHAPHPWAKPRISA